MLHPETKLFRKVVFTIAIEKQGEFKSGWDANRPGQDKKLNSQMSRDEKDYLVHLIRETNRVVLHPHLQWKRDTGQISFDLLTIERMFRAKRLKFHIKEFSIIELNDGTTDHRVLIRSNRTEKVTIDGRGDTPCNLMFVLSLDTREIVTAYYVHIHNHFDKPNMERYNANLDVIGTLQGSERQIRPVSEERPPQDDLTHEQWMELFDTAAQT